MAAPTNKESPPVFAYVSIFVLGLMTSAGIQVVRDLVITTNQRDVARVTSPDGMVDAVFVEPVLRALSDSALYLVPKGEPVPARGPQLKGTRFSPLPVLVWKQTHLLQVNYRSGCINGFTNLWHSYDLDEGKYYVELSLNPASEFPCIGSALKGGNL